MKYALLALLLLPAMLAQGTTVTFTEEQIREHAQKAGKIIQEQADYIFELEEVIRKNKSHIEKLQGSLNCV